MQKFHIGDVVKYVGNAQRTWKKDEIHIIAQCEFLDGEFQYGTDYGAWFDTNDFTLVHRATKATLKKLSQLDEEDEE
jgi:hypothetical protein